MGYMPTEVIETMSVNGFFPFERCLLRKGEVTFCKDLDLSFCRPLIQIRMKLQSKTSRDPVLFPDEQILELMDESNIKPLSTNTLDKVEHLVRRCGPLVGPIWSFR